MIKIINQQNIKVRPSISGIDVIFKDKTELFITNAVLTSLMKTSKSFAGERTINDKINAFILDENRDDN